MVTPIYGKIQDLHLPFELGPVEKYDPSKHGA